MSFLFELLFDLFLFGFLFSEDEKPAPKDTSSSSAQNNE